MTASGARLGTRTLMLSSQRSRDDHVHTASWSIGAHCKLVLDREPRTPTKSHTHQLQLGVSAACISKNGVTKELLTNTTHTQGDHTYCGAAAALHQHTAQASLGPALVQCFSHFQRYRGQPGTKIRAKCSKMGHGTTNFHCSLRDFASNAE